VDPPHHQPGSDDIGKSVFELGRIEASDATASARRHALE